jgi:hypothetical protein
MEGSFWQLVLDLDERRIGLKIRKLEENLKVLSARKLDSRSDGLKAARESSANIPDGDAEVYFVGRGNAPSHSQTTTRL